MHTILTHNYADAQVHSTHICTHTQVHNNIHMHKYIIPTHICTHYQAWAYYACIILRIRGYKFRKNNAGIIGCWQA